MVRVGGSLRDLMIYKYLCAGGGGEGGADGAHGDELKEICGKLRDDSYWALG